MANSWKNELRWNIVRQKLDSDQIFKISLKISKNLIFVQFRSVQLSSAPKYVTIKSWKSLRIHCKSCRDKIMFYSDRYLLP